MSYQGVTVSSDSIVQLSKDKVSIQSLWRNRLCMYVRTYVHVLVEGNDVQHGSVGLQKDTDYDGWVRSYVRTYNTRTFIM